MGTAPILDNTRSPSPFMAPASGAFCLLFAYANCRLCRAVQILITTSCSTYVKLFERGLNESFIASVFCDQELDGQV